jgi:paraquat-inducible protein A
MSASPPGKLSSCHCCGLVQQLPALQNGEQPLCCRCNSTLRHGGANHWAAALAASALVFYPPAMLLPMMSLEKLGHRHEDSLLSGLFALFTQGYIFIGMIVLLFSVLLPPFKLIILLVLSASAKLRSSHRAILYHAVELLGRWGMLDVMLMAVLVAFVKLGDVVNIHAGAGLWAFALMVLLSLCASLMFNPHLMWADDDG